MSQFGRLTKYIPMIQTDPIGQWIIDQENDGSPEHPIQMPFADYSNAANHFIRDVHAFHEHNQDMGLTRYEEILKDNGLAWNSESMKNADVSHLNAQCVLALIMAAVRAERYSDGALLDFFQNGCIKRWLERLQSLESPAANP
ncbi:MAG: hypothetical protein GXY67_11320 [Clostridiales bacterium]|nr:hypothetical protein [Clostridiales bacterium]